MAFNGTDFEREELRWLLNSGVLGRSRNLARMLKFVCEKQLDGKTDEITEPAVAIEALGRRSDFDPQTDTIVRVTAHLLRKRLQEIYQGEGASRPVHILIPHGQYVPSFVPNENSPDGSMQSVSEVAEPKTVPGPSSLGRPRPFLVWLAVGAGIVVCLALVIAVRLWKKPAPIPAPPVHSATAKIFDPRKPVRILLGSGRKPYLDHSGYAWTPGDTCKGGSSVSEPDQQVAATQDPQVFLGGIRGNAHCLFPVPSGVYEVRLLFAETSDLPEATSRAVFFLNGSDSKTLDVVDDAGGNRIATIKVFRGVRPQNDGAIHIDFISEISLLKAVEILPAPSESMLPIRIVAGRKSYTDANGDVWLADRYFVGGRFGEDPDPNKPTGSGVYAFHRVGNFRYLIPVIPFEKYRVRLYFQEPWFGKQSGGVGGAHSRVFNVACNGSTLLRDFDIWSDTGPSPTIKTFEHIQATAQGKLELSFTPVANYALINAIEILPDSAN